MARVGQDEFIVLLSGLLSHRHFEGDGIWINTFPSKALYNTILIKKCKKKVLPKKLVHKLTGIYDDKSKKGYKVKKRGLKRKTFYYRQISKEEAYEKARKYVLRFDE